MRLLLLALLVFNLSAAAQKTINNTPINDLKLNTSLSQYDNDVRLITGYEEIYANFPNLKENVLKNISNGIREGLYGGFLYNGIDGIPSSRTTLFFYNEELYKVRWFFLASDNANLENVATQLNKYLEKLYGPGDEQIPGLLKVWQTKKRYIQSFSDETEFQIEYRDEKIHQKVEKLKQ